MGTVNKDAIVRAVALATGQTMAEAKAAIEAFCTAVQTRAAAGDTVRLMGFGSFQVKSRAARRGRNMATGEEMDIPETTRLTFKAPKVS